MGYSMNGNCNPSGETLQSNHRCDGLEKWIKGVLSGLERSSTDFDLSSGPERDSSVQLKPASVLIGIMTFDGKAQVVLTKRSSRLARHPGQVALPGGRQERRDADVVAAALREAKEEIGLPTAHVCVLGKMPQHETITGFAITPVVALIYKPFEIRVEASEVDEVFTVPFDCLVRRANYQVQSRQWKGQQRAYYTIPYGPYYIWGATARIFFSLAEGWERCLA